MPQELEIKLTLSPAAQKRAHNWLLMHAPAEAAPAQTLVNIYYDTPSTDLARLKAALRVRQVGGEFIQTLKTRGELVNGAHRREEWEWPLPSARLDTELLKETPIAGRLPLADLTPVFETNFERRPVILDDGLARIECAFDSGRIIAGAQQRALHELELELKAGAESQLLVWARRLAAEAAMFLNPISKAEQGYYLAGLALPPKGRESDPCNEFNRALGRLWLTGEGMAAVLDAMAALEDRAREQDVLADWQWLRERMAGDTGGDPFSDSRLGRFQLALVAPSNDA
ncbi:MAG: CYTH domain-containing protein [Marinobacter sp.]|uniref:CYTH domain-containing protein n=1 Tax=Marinobacter sp. TaxID=50741 RepID=UPI00299D8E11|nr:CYTH domain-containing protein [Marinobacter sp.]MDX1635000.1 CYTH domain-containing protein [Marinobacter sp.]